VSNKTDLSSKNMMYLREDGTPTSRVVVDADYAEACQALSSAFEAFSIKLMRRMAPDVVRADGIPSPDELISIMTDAVDNPEYEEPSEDEFRM
jgi:hypothetical protein